jgi:glycerol-3-phosphate dehydrogenase
LAQQNSREQQIPCEKHSIEPIALETEIEFVLETAQRYLVKKKPHRPMCSVFAGLRPLAARWKSTKEVS